MSASFELYTKRNISFIGAIHLVIRQCYERSIKNPTTDLERMKNVMLETMQKAAELIRDGYGDYCFEDREEAFDDFIYRYIHHSYRYSSEGVKKMADEILELQDGEYWKLAMITSEEVSLFQDK